MHRVPFSVAIFIEVVLLIGLIGGMLKPEAIIIFIINLVFIILALAKNKAEREGVDLTEVFFSAKESAVEEKIRDSIKGITSDNLAIRIDSLSYLKRINNGNSSKKNILYGMTDEYGNHFSSEVVDQIIRYHISQIEKDPNLTEKEKKKLIKVTDPKKYGSKVTITFAICMVSTATLLYVAWYFLGPAHQYDSAMKKMRNNQLSDALAEFESIETYKDSESMINELKYQIARNEFNEGNYEKAIERFDEISKYKDAKKCSQEAKYQLIKEKFENKDYDSVISLCGEIRDYKDALSIREESYYMAGKMNYESGQYKESLDYLKYASEDGQSLILSIADKYIKEGKLEDALKALELVNDEKKTAELAAYIDGETAYQNKEYEKASGKLKNVYIYNAAEHCKESLYYCGIEKCKRGNYEDAMRKLSGIKEYRDAEEYYHNACLMYAVSEMKVGDIKQAATAIEELPNDYICDGYSCSMVRNAIQKAEMGSKLKSKWSAQSGYVRTYKQTKTMNDGWEYIIKKDEPNNSLSLKVKADDNMNIYLDINVSFNYFTDYDDDKGMLEIFYKVKNIHETIDLDKALNKAVTLDEHTKIRITNDKCILDYSAPGLYLEGPTTVCVTHIVF